jgi:hypothetical protein
VGREQFLGHSHQTRLADGGAGLQIRQVARPPRVAQHSHPGANRSGGDQHYLAAGPALLGHLRHQLFHLRAVRLLPAVRQDPGAELDHDARYVLEPLSPHVRTVSSRIGPRGKG